MLRLGSFIRSMFQEERGAVLPMFGLMFFSFFLLLIGVAYDLGRQQIVHAKMKHALDAAALAMASVPNPAARQEVAQAYFEANFPTGVIPGTDPLDYMTSDMNEVVVTEFKGDENRLGLSVSGQVYTAFMRYAQAKSLEKLGVSSSTEVSFTKDTSGMELVLALDNTGSMRGTKITALKKASKGMLDIVYDKKNVIPNVWVGLVPFTTTVNIDYATFNSWDPYFSLIIDNRWNAWKNYLVERDGNDTNGVPFSESEEMVTTVDAKQLDIMPHFKPTPDWCPNCYFTSHSFYFPPRYWVDQFNGFNVNESGNRLHPMRPGMSQLNVIKNEIDNMGTNGDTNTAAGMLWAWRLLSPNWKGIWSNKGLPKSYNANGMKKVVVLLTDGVSNNCNYHKGDYGAGCNPSDLNAKLSRICSSMKDKGIQIYTVLFDIQSVPNATQKAEIIDTMRSCATLPGYFFDSPTPEQLVLDFKVIGLDLASLRITK